MNLKSKIIVLMFTSLLFLTSCLDKTLHETKKDIEFIRQRSKGLINGKISLRLTRDILFQNMIYETEGFKLDIYCPNTFESNQSLSEAFSFDPDLYSETPYIRNYNDTLFAFIDSNVFKWNPDSQKWNHDDKHIFFRIPPYFLFQDRCYSFYYLDRGEWGSYLLIEDRYKKQTRYFSVGRKIMQVYKNQKSYHFILATSESMSKQSIKYSSIYQIVNIDSLPYYNPATFKNSSELASLDTQIDKQHVKILDSTSNIYGLFDTGVETIKLVALDDTLPLFRGKRKVYLCDENSKKLDFPYKNRAIELGLWGSSYMDALIQEFDSYYICEVAFDDASHFLKINKTKD